MSYRFADSFLATEHVDVMLVITEEIPSKKVLRLFYTGDSSGCGLMKCGTLQSCMRIASLVRRIFCNTSDFGRDVDEVFTIMGCKASYVVNGLQSFGTAWRSHRQDSSSLRRKTPDDGQSNCPKHVEFYSKKFQEISASRWFYHKKLKIYFNDVYL